MFCFFRLIQKDHVVFVFLCLQLISLSLSSISIHVVANGTQSHSFSTVIFHCIHIYTSFLFFLSRLLPYLSYYKWCCNKHYNLYIFFELVFLSFLGIYIYPQTLLDYMAVQILIFWGSSILFFTAAVSIYNSTNSAQGYTFLHIIIISTCYYLYDGHSDRCKVVSHCGFNLHFLDD